MAEEPKHPGKIIFVDGATNQVTNEMDASEVPFNIRFVETEKGLVPCVKVVSYEAEKQRYIRQYGPNDEFLMSTLMISEE